MPKLTLPQWLKQQKKTRAGFSKQICVSKRVVYDWCLPFGHPDRRIPSHGAMCAIYVATAGQVTPDSFYDLPDLAPSQPAASDLVELVEKGEAA